MKSDRRITMNDLNREVLQHNKLPDLVLDKLMEWIMSGKLSMGDKLNTEELASQLGVSRMPIREALSNLEKKGHRGVDPVCRNKTHYTYKRRCKTDLHCQNCSGTSGSEVCM